MAWRSVVLALAFVCLPLRPHAQILRLAVAVRHTGDDAVGTQFATRLRGALQGSRAFFLADEPHAVAIVSLISQDRLCAAKGNGSSVAVIYLDHEARYLMAAIHSVGADAIEVAVGDVLRDLEQHSRAFR